MWPAYLSSQQHFLLGLYLANATGYHPEPPTHSSSSPEVEMINLFMWKNVAVLSSRQVLMKVFFFEICLYDAFHVRVSKKIHNLILHTILHV